MFSRLQSINGWLEVNAGSWFEVAAIVGSVYLFVFHADAFFMDVASATSLTEAEEVLCVILELASSLV